MKFGDMLLRLCDYYAVDGKSERVQAVIDYLEERESVNIENLCKYILERFKYFPTISEISKYVKSSHYELMSLKKLPADSKGLYISKENLEKFGYKENSNYLQKKKQLSSYTTNQLAKYLEDGIVTEKMNENLFVQSMLRLDKNKKIDGSNRVLK